jgi:phosphotransferase system  glucose/maltose/N-acetylglucosamine-specific IIC component
VKKILVVLIVAMIALPVAAIATFLLTPVWRWLESTTHIESIGHSGPAGWCFVAIYLAILLTAAGVWLRVCNR